MAAKQYRSIAEIAQRDNDLEKAKSYFKLAADNFEVEDSQTTADKLKLQVGFASKRFDGNLSLWHLMSSLPSVDCRHSGPAGAVRRSLDLV